MFNQGQSWEKEGIFKKIRGNQRSSIFRIVLFQSNDFLHTPSHIHKSMTIANFTPLCIILFCTILLNHESIFYEAILFYSQELGHRPSKPTSVQSSDKILIEGFKSITENQRKLIALH